MANRHLSRRGDAQNKTTDDGSLIVNWRLKAGRRPRCRSSIDNFQSPILNHGNGKVLNCEIKLYHYPLLPSLDTPIFTDKVARLSGRGVASQRTPHGGEGRFSM